VYAIVSLTSSAGARDFRLLQPELAPHSFLGVPWTGLLGDGLVPWFGLMMDYADDEFVAVTRSGPKEDSAVIGRDPVIDGRLVSTVAAGLNLYSIGALSLVVPFFMTQGPDLAGGIVAGDVNLNLRARIAGADDEGFGFGIAAGLGFPSGSVSGWTGSGKITGHFGLMWHFQSRDGFRIAFSVKRRFRPTLALPGSVIGSDLRWGLAGRVPLHRRIGLTAELDGVAGSSDRSTSIAARTYAIEGRVGLLIDVGLGFEVRPFWGAGLTTGLGAPDFHVGLGLQWSPPGLRPLQAPVAANTSRPPTPDLEPARPLTPLELALQTPEQALSRKVAAFEAPAPIDASSFADSLAADPDADGDGVRGKADKCPEQAEDIDSFEDDDGCPDLDNDQDTIPDTQDQCPLEPETFNGVADDDGCPEADSVDAGPTFDAVDDAFDLGEIAFQSGSDQLKDAAKPQLEKFALFFQGRTRLGRLVIEGHTDDRGDREFNVDLSERRAAAVRAFLVAEGVAPERLVARGYGATRPVASNNNAAGKARNRRVVFRIDKDLEGRRTPAGGRR